MEQAEKKYGEVIGFLRRSKPGIRHPEIMTEKILDKIGNQKNRTGFLESIGNFVFGWVYIGWVRKGMIAFSTIILLLFIYQQSVIIRRINSIDRQVVTAGISSSQVVRENIDPGNLLKRIEFLMPAAEKELSQKNVDALIESLSDLQVKYRDILKLIQEDPELRKYFEKRLNEKNSNIFNPR